MVMPLILYPVVDGRKVVAEILGCYEVCYHYRYFQDLG